ncbi:MAG TPA: putative toxin-antitoxin system toxin component, PIN family [Solirubrobacterales bacterium]|nr:putative toxin-antitoxin system toxin component, PIN family [Solirubrobacterales bacterium]
MRVVVDTNVWVSGLAFPDGTPGRVIQAVRQGTVEAVASWELAAEITEVLRRPRIRALGVTEEDEEDALVLLAPALPDVDVEVELRDPDDAPVIAAALAGSAAAIVTGDRGLLDDAELRKWLGARGVELLEPAELLVSLQAQHS